MTYPADKILHEMMLLHTMFCMPEIVLDKETGRLVSYTYKWVNVIAEGKFNRLQEMYSIEIERQRRQEQERYTRTMW